MAILLSTAYFPNVHYFSKAVATDNILIEVHENYQKQSYRNRCIIHAANGAMGLTIPILKGRSLGQKIKDIRIDYAMPWQKNHFKSIESAYTHSPFYEFLIDDLMPFFEKRQEFLLDLNIAILGVLLEQIGLSNISVGLSENYETIQEQEDWRKIIHPKKDIALDQEFYPHQYQQNFEEKNGFQPNLSILDTLFQLGPETRKYLSNCRLKPETQST